MKSPEVSVLVNCYNSERFLKQALDSIAQQTFRDFEVIFVDNQSTDLSAEIAKSYDERFRYIRTPHFMTLYAARQFGLQYVRGKYLAVLDSDDYWAEDKLSYQVEKIKMEKVDFLYNDFQLKFECASFGDMLRSRVSCVSHRLKSYFKRSGQRNLDDLTANYDINLQTILFDFEKAKGLSFDSNLNLLGDLDFFFRLIMERKFRFFFDSKIVATYRIHSGQLTRKSLKRWAIEGRYCYLFKYRNFFSQLQRRQFENYVVLFKGRYYASTEKKKKALELQKKIRFMSLARFLSWLKLLAICVFAGS